MSWLTADRSLQTLGDALALCPDLLAGYRALDARREGVDERRGTRLRTSSGRVMLKGFTDVIRSLGAVPPRPWSRTTHPLASRGDTNHPIPGSP